MTDLKEQIDVKEKALTEAKQTVKAQEAALVAAGQAELTDENAIYVHVSHRKAKQIKTQMVGGVRCLVVPIEKGESASINGVPAEL